MDANVAIIPIIGMSIPIVLVPVILGLRHARQERHLEHAERMRALELGRTLPKDEPWWSPPRICVAFGVGVPMGVFACAASVTSSTDVWALPVWIAAGAVGVAGVVSGAVLAYHHFEQTAAASRGHADPYHSKPNVDADAFDVVGSRG